MSADFSGIWRHIAVFMGVSKISGTGKWIFLPYKVPAFFRIFLAFFTKAFIVKSSGVHSGLVTHVPIPNTIDKGPCGDGTAYLTAGE